MDKKNIDFKSLKSKIKKITTKAQINNLIKPISEAFKDFSVNDEIHKGKKEFFTD